MIVLFSSLVINTVSGDPARNARNEKREEAKEEISDEDKGKFRLRARITRYRTDK